MAEDEGMIVAIFSCFIWIHDNITETFKLLYTGFACWWNEAYS